MVCREAARTCTRAGDHLTRLMVPWPACVLPVAQGPPQSLYEAAAQNDVATLMEWIHTVPRDELDTELVRVPHSPPPPGAMPRCGEGEISLQRLVGVHMTLCVPADADTDTCPPASAQHPRSHTHTRAGHVRVAYCCGGWRDPGHD